MAKLSENKTSTTHIRFLALNHLIQLHVKINPVLPRVPDKIIRGHQQYIDQQIEDVVGNIENVIAIGRSFINFKSNFCGRLNRI